MKKNIFIPLFASVRPHLKNSAEAKKLGGGYAAVKPIGEG